MTTWILSALLFSILGWSEAVSPYRTYWFSPYGPEDHGRPYPFDGEYIGKMTTVQCSRFCADDTSCKAYEFEKTDGRLGNCYIYDVLTYNTIMVPRPGHKYYEKRHCFEVYHFTAAIVYPENYRMILFVKDKTFIFNVTKVDSITMIRGIYLSIHDRFFPGLTGEVDGAFIGPDNDTYIVQGNTVKCYKSIYQNYTEFEACGSPILDLLDNYFATESYLDAVVSLGDPSNVDVITNNTVHRLVWNEGSRKYDVGDSFSISDSGSQNIWSMAPKHLTAMSQLLTADTYLLIEDYKLVFYDAASTRATTVIFLCK